jgi:hypothetical protein
MRSFALEGHIAHQALVLPEHALLVRSKTLNARMQKMIAKFALQDITAQVIRLHPWLVH